MLLWFLVIGIWDDVAGSGFRIPAGTRSVFFLNIVKHGVEAHPASCSQGTGVLPLGLKLRELVVDYSPPPSADVKFEEP